MNLLDFPLVAEATACLRFQKLYPKEPILERKIFYAKTQHQFAAAFLALWAWKGQRPVRVPENDFQRSSIALAENVARDIHNYRPDKVVKLRKDVFELIDGVMNRLTVCAYSGVKGSTYLESVPSDLARRQAVEHRNKIGFIHRGSRVTRKREICHTFDEKYPSHW